MVQFAYKQKGVLPGTTGAIHAVTYSSAPHTHLLSGGSSRTVYLHNPGTLTPISTFPAGHTVLALAVAHTNAHFASATTDRLVFLWDVLAGSTLVRFAGHEARVNDVAFSADSAVLVSAGYDTTVRCWDVRAGGRREVQCFREARDAVMAVDVRGVRIAAGSVDGRVRVYDVRVGRCYEDVVCPAGVTGVKMSADGEGYLVAGLDGVVRLMDVRSGGLLKAYKGRAGGELRVGLDWAEREEGVVAGSEAGEVWCWDMVDGEVRQRVKGHKGAVTSTVYCPARREMVSAGVDGRVIVWEG